VLVLTALYTLSLLDRQVLSLLIAPIRADLGISDFQIGVLQGIAFALFYSLFGLPFGAAADRMSRQRLIFAGVTIWALAASACGLARTYPQMLLARFTMGIGEAALLPAAYSLIAELFPPWRLGLALSIFSTGSTLGSGLALAGGGLLIAALPAAGAATPFGHFAPWQLVFIITGLPCFLFSGLIFTVREPRRLKGAAQPAPPIAETFRFIGRHRRFFLGHWLGFGLLAMCGFGLIVWAPTYMVRRFHWPMSSVGVAIALAVSVAGSIGPVIVGAAVDAWFRKGRSDAHLRIYAVVALLQALLVLGAMTTDTPAVFLALLTLDLSLAAFAGPAAAALQIVTPPPLRGQISAGFSFSMAIVGTGLGPMVVAAVTDFVFRSDAKVGWSIAATFLVFAPIVSALLVYGAGGMRRAVAQLGSDGSA
jgi:MFS family permease